MKKKKKLIKLIDVIHPTILPASVGLLFGICFAVIFFEYVGYQFKGIKEEISIYRWKKSVSNDEYFIRKRSPNEPIKKHQNIDKFKCKDENNVADALKKKVRVLCWVMTSPVNHKRKAFHIKQTWGKHCNSLLFMSTKVDKELSSVALPVKEGRNNLWEKTREAFKYIYKNYNGSYDWIIKADDDTFVILENLRYMLKDFDPMESIYFGLKFKTFVKQGYMSGGAGYVLSKEAVRKFVEALSDKKCNQDSEWAEDVEIGRCLELIGVKAKDSRDHLGRGRFFPFKPENHLYLFNALPKWFWKYIYYPSWQGMNCCSDNAITFHYVSPQDMYVYEYFLFHLRPYGIRYNCGRIVFVKKKIKSENWMTIPYWLKRRSGYIKILEKNDRMLKEDILDGLKRGKEVDKYDIGVTY
ncbi:hypothetical protein PGB90_003153 [Kerria lacca]